MTDATTSQFPPGRGAWRETDPAGGRLFTDIGDLPLEFGGVLPRVRVAYETFGELSPDADNAVLLCHALTADSHALGPTGPGHPTPGWWPEMVGPGRPLDTDSWCVVVPNVLGGCQGSTGPSSLAPDGRAWGSRFPYLSVRDQVAAEAALAQALGITTWAGVVGASMGGMRALEWAVTHPDRVRRLLAIATTARASADQIAWCTPQLAAIRSDSHWQGGDYHGGRFPEDGLRIARMIAHATYRSAAELDARFGRDVQAGEDPYGGGGRFAVESYLQHAGDKLVRRFDAGSYVSLTESMNSHDVGRGRGGVPSALARVRAATRVVAVDSDRLYPVHLSQEIAAGIPTAGDVDVISSPYGHDGFLIESEALAKVTHELFDSSADDLSADEAPAGWARSA